mgnify:CR=1 FL=1
MVDKNKQAFINFLASSLNNDGFIVADKLDYLYRRLKSIMNDNNMKLKNNITDDLFYMKFCYFIFENRN